MTRGAKPGGSAEERTPVRECLTVHLERELKRWYAIRASGKGTLNLTRMQAVEKELQHRENVRRMHRAAYGYGPKANQEPECSHPVLEGDDEGLRCFDCGELVRREP